ncbi:ras-specific guanine nucleotide-releasing factor RalGPS2-like [Hemitrygon akajei]|uniref:ras-specific guanine nucleotide-releasing factor RalGPS2-like n=1 Tax=Hemitrygon akajei TaxID=2704970 RepID=UPI003BF9F1B5
MQITFRAKVCPQTRSLEKPEQATASASVHRRALGHRAQRSRSRPQPQPQFIAEPSGTEPRGAEAGHSLSLSSSQSPWAQSPEELKQATASASVHRRALGHRAQRSPSRPQPQFIAEPSGTEPRGAEAGHSLSLSSSQSPWAQSPEELKQATASASVHRRALGHRAQRSWSRPQPQPQFIAEPSGTRAQRSWKPRGAGAGHSLSLSSSQGPRAQSPEELKQATASASVHRRALGHRAQRSWSRPQPQPQPQFIAGPSGTEPRGAGAGHSLSLSSSQSPRAQSPEELEQATATASVHRRTLGHRAQRSWSRPQPQPQFIAGPSGTEPRGAGVDHSLSSSQGPRAQSPEELEQATASASVHRRAKCLTSVEKSKNLVTSRKLICLLKSPSVASAEGESGSQSSKKSFDLVVFDALMVPPQQFANQITLLDAAVFRSIQPEELSSCAWNKKGKYSLAPNVVASTRRFNQVSFWVVREILTKQMLKTRVDVLSHFIKMAKKLLNLNNLHGLMAVISALQSSPIFRLSKTWMLLSRKDKATFEKLETLLSKEDNYKELRAYISCLRNKPCIPYLGTYLSDLTYIDAAYPATASILEDERRSDQINNILRVISDFQQSCVYDLPSLPHVQMYLDSEQYIEELQSFLEQDNYRLSQLLEPVSWSPRRASEREAEGPLSSTEAVEFSDDDATVTCLRLMRGHRKWKSADYHSRRASITDPKRASFLSGRPHSLLDDSVMEDSLPWVMQAENRSPDESWPATQEESSDNDEQSTRPTFERTRLYHSLGTEARKTQSCSRDVAGPILPDGQGCATIESLLRRKTILKNGKKPLVSAWTTYWVALCDYQLVYYGAKSLKSTERKQFKSSYCKRLSIVGWIPVLIEDPESEDMFQLTDPEHENSYKFLAGSRMNAMLWFKHLSRACKTNWRQLPTNLMSFE